MEKKYYDLLNSNFWVKTTSINYIINDLSIKVFTLYYYNLKGNIMKSILYTLDCY